MVRRYPGTAVAGDATAGHAVYSGTGTSVKISLRSGRTYTFVLFSHDTVGNVSAAAVLRSRAP